MMPPMLLRFSIYEAGKKKINFWLPLILLYLLVLPVFLCLLPFLIVFGLVAFVFGVGKNPVSWMIWLYELWCAAKGIVIEVESKTERVYIRII